MDSHNSIKTISAMNNWFTAIAVGCLLLQGCSCDLVEEKPNFTATVLAIKYTGEAEEGMARGRTQVLLSDGNTYYAGSSGMEAVYYSTFLKVDNTYEFMVQEEWGQDRVIPIFKPESEAK